MKTRSRRPINSVVDRVDDPVGEDLEAVLACNTSILRQIKATMVTKDDVEKGMEVIRGYQARMAVWGPALERSNRALAKSMGFTITATGDWVREP